MRAYHKSWQDKRPGFTKRVRWYQGQAGETLSIRLHFEDYGEHRACNRFYTDHGEATRDYETFIAGEVTVKELMNAREA